MILIMHILVALASLAWTGYAYLNPSAKKLLGSHALVAGTLASGTALVISTGSPLINACLTGLAYLAIVYIGIFMTHRKLRTTKPIKIN